MDLFIIHISVFYCEQQKFKPLKSEEITASSGLQLQDVCVATRHFS